MPSLRDCRYGRRVHFFTATDVAKNLEQAKKYHQFDRFLQPLNRVDLLIIDEMGYLAFSLIAAELHLPFFTERFERKSLLNNRHLTVEVSPQRDGVRLKENLYGRIDGR
ncbi:ATP-binding protein [Telmatocola sphagniphila]|uniref:ATP-binding protein n=1 Tax=Telmatocola sphagniphila TaxID=1123043 RepID=A0A8E6ETS8_9BACT|nr:ATP-binding protein [Telmatocola sphagniphila]QVL30352.1 ATP-binding protein [Telmatocola sphagniphila]